MSKLVVHIGMTIFLALVSGCSPIQPVMPPPTPTPTATVAPTPTLTPALAPRPTLFRGVNLGNYLEAPKGQDWGYTLQPTHLALIAEAGFDHVRVPIRWSDYALEDPPYTIEPAFFERVDAVVADALAHGLRVVINMHHYEQLMRLPREHKARFLALWEQIAAHYAAQPPELYFELLNEPNGALTPQLWNEFAAEAIAVVRRSNPNRTLVIGTADWGGIYPLYYLELPDDPNLIITYHYYYPFEFTHQGAEWVEGSSAWLARTWDGTPEEVRAVANDMDYALLWAQRKGWRLWMGEFGAYSRADMASRARWTYSVAREAEKRGIGWAYWEFGAGFGVYDPAAGIWRQELLEALIPPE